MDLFRYFIDTVKDRRGSLTIEYVMIMAAGALIASLLVGVVNSEPV